MNKRYFAAVVCGLVLSTLSMAAGQTPVTTGPAGPAATTAPTEGAQGATTAPAEDLPEIAPGFQPGRMLPTKAVRPANGCWPVLNWPTVGWFGALAVLALTLRLRPLFSVRNLDGLVLAGMCILLVLREYTGPMCGGHSGPWWAATGLTVATAYWLLRGLHLILSRRIKDGPLAITPGVVLVFLVAGIVLSAARISDAAIGAGSRAGIIGGLYFAEIGKLPYGDVPQADAYGPLHHLLHAGAVKVLPPRGPANGEALEAPLTWSNRREWIEGDWAAVSDVRAVPLVNTVLLVVTLAGLYALGRRLHSDVAGVTMVALFAIFPGALECLARPEVMLTAALLTWALALALVRGLGGILGVFVLVVAGVNWPWAWLALPVMLAYFWRRGAGGVLASLIGLVGGVAVILLIVYHFVAPSLPRTDAALALAGAPPTLDAQVRDGKVVLERAERQPAGPAPISQGLWQILLSTESACLRDGTQQAGVAVEWPDASTTAPVNADAVLYRDLNVDADARAALQPSYRAMLANLAADRRLVVSLRTLLEATWRPGVPSAPMTKPAWAIWTGQTTGEVRWAWVRRAMKIGAVIVVLLAALFILLRKATRERAETDTVAPGARSPVGVPPAPVALVELRPVGPRQLIGGVLVALAAALLASEVGPMTNLVWLLPALLALWAIPEETPVIAVGQPAPMLTPVTRLGGGPLGPEPRITNQ